VAEQLHAEEPTGGLVAGDADGDVVAAGVVGLVVIGLGFGGDRGESGRSGFVVAQPGAGGGLVEDLDDLGAQAAGEPPVPAQGVLPGRSGPGPSRTRCRAAIPPATTRPSSTSATVSGVSRRA